ncbi:cytidylyltransferase domain-containing protein [Maricaulis sp. CAU 1757]
MSLAVIIQARIGSSRLRGKVLDDLGGVPLVRRVLDRCARIPSADVVMAAIPDDAVNDPLETAIRQAGYPVFRGSESDVLARYAGAARVAGREYIMRVTSDCPFIDPQLCEAVFQLLRESGADYANNTLIPAYPHGLDCEVFPRRWLDAASVSASAADEREHVTPWIRNNPKVTTACLEGPGGDVGRLRWTVDYPEDMDMAKAVFDTLGPQAAGADWQSLASLFRDRPALQQINAGRRIERVRVGADIVRAGTG